MNTHVEAPQPTENTYILTLDLGEKLQAFRHLGLEAPGPYDQYTRDIQNELVSTLQNAMPDGTKVEPVYMRDLADNVLGAASRICDKLTDPIILSTCPEIADPSKGVELEINRLVDSKGRNMGLGPRPGHPSLDQQIQKHGAQLRDKQVVIVEDGIFSGSTIRHVAQKLKDRGITTAAIVAGFKCTESSLAWLQHADYDLTTTNKYHNVVDWIPDHDFLPFIPGCGKVIGADMGKEPFPFYDYRGANFAIPYIKPYGPSAEWASIPHAEVGNVSRKCLELASTIFKDLVKLNPDEDITIGRLLSAKQRTSVPLAINNTNFPDLRKRVDHYLEEVSEPSPLPCS
jgi:hypothetical protein